MFDDPFEVKLRRYLKSVKPKPGNLCDISPQKLSFFLNTHSATRIWMDRTVGLTDERGHVRDWLTANVCAYVWLSRAQDTCDLCECVCVLTQHPAAITSLTALTRVVRLLCKTTNDCETFCRINRRRITHVCCYGSFLVHHLQPIPIHQGLVRYREEAEGKPVVCMCVWITSDVSGKF